MSRRTGSWLVLGMSLCRVARCLLGLAVALPVSAARLTSSAGLVTRLSFTDNAFLSPTDRQSDALLQVLPYFTAQTSEGRLSGRIAYGPSLILYANRSDLNQVVNVLQANATAEIIKKYFSLSAVASAGQALIDPGSIDNRAGFDYADDPDAYTPYATFNIVPSIVIPVLGVGGKYAQLSIDPGINYVAAVDGALGQDNQGSLGSSTSVRLTSGPYFTNMPWGLAYSTNIFDTDTNDGYDSVTGSVNYRFNPIYLATLTLGYSQGNYDSSSSTSGPSWQLGFTWTPNPRNSLAIGYGESYFGNNSFLNFRHRHKRTVWSANYSVTVQNARQALLNQETIPANDAFGNPILDPFSRRQLYPVANTPVLIDDVYVGQNLTASMATSKGRTNIDFTANIWRNTYQQDQQPTTLTSSLTLSLLRALTPKTSGSLSLQYWDYSQDGPIAGDDNWTDYDQFQLALGLNRRLGAKTSGALTFYRTERHADVEENTYDENRVSLTLSMRFK